MHGAQGGLNRTTTVRAGQSQICRVDLPTRNAASRGNTFPVLWVYSKERVRGSPMLMHDAKLTR